MLFGEAATLIFRPLAGFFTIMVWSTNFGLGSGLKREVGFGFELLVFSRLNSPAVPVPVLVPLPKALEGWIVAWLYIVAEFGRRIDLLVVDIGTMGKCRSIG